MAYLAQLGLPEESGTDASWQIQILKHQVAALQWEKLALQEKLISLTRFTDRFSADTLPLVIPARILVHRDSSNNRQTYLIDRGKRHGVSIGDVVVFGDTLVGRVIEVGKQVSRVLKLSDPATKIAIMILPTSNQEDSIVGEGMAEGDSSQCQLKFLERSSQLRSGCFALTSGQNGEYPRGLVVGELQEQEEGSYGLFWNASIKILDTDAIQTVLVISTHSKNIIGG
jgi:rod shape-determining protein MreC